MTLPWNLDAMHAVAAYRSDFLTSFFNFWSDVGDVPGYLLIITLLYTAINRALAVRLAVLLLVTICVNHILKTLIGNPRPFVVDGSWAEMWVVSKGHVESLVLEYSTPSGHAMSVAAFYTYLAAATRRRWLSVAAVIVMLLVGLSRPYLGVHYFEDILLGWLLGGLLAWGALRYGDSIERHWERLSFTLKATRLVVFSVGMRAFTYFLGATAPDQPPLSIIGNLGFLTGVLLAAHLERQRVGYEVAPGTVLQKVGRWLLLIACVGATMLALSSAADQMVERASAMGHLVKYLRYTAVGFAGLLLAPYLFVRLRLAAPQGHK